MLIGIVLWPDHSWGFMFGRGDWAMRKGALFDARVTIDGLSVGSGKARAISTSIAVKKLGNSAYQLLRRGNVIRISTRGLVETLSLKGSNAALGALLSCVENGSVTTASIRRRPDASEKDPQVPASEALVIVSNILSSAGVTGHQFAPPKGNLVKWTFADGAEGAFMAFRGFKGDPNEAASQFISGISKGCTGDFVTAKKALPTTDGTVIRNITSACKIKGLSVVTQTSIVERRGLLLVFNHTSVPGTGMGGAEEYGSGSINQELAQQAVLTMPE
jgi:hypothetical protein